MPRTRRFEEKIEVVEYYLKHGNIKSTAQRFNISETSISHWLLMYHEKGPESLKVRSTHSTYSTDFKERVVREHLKTGIGYRPIARKYNIPCHKSVKKWVIAYTEGRPLKSTFGGTHSMTESRKTKFEERLNIVQYHEAHDISIRELSELFDVTYQQAYQYVKKYEKAGQYSLEDRRAAVNQTVN